MSDTSSETYAYAIGGGVLRGSDGAAIPNDPANSDWRDFQDWLAAGNVATPYTPPPVIHTCQLWQLQAVLSADQWGQVQSAIQGMNNPVLSAFFQHGTNMIPSNSTTLLQLGRGIGLSADQVAALVEQASQVAIP